MKIVTNITADPNQVFTLIGEEGEQITFVLYFLPYQNGWFCDITWGTFTVTGLQVLVGPNILRQWKNILTFGICIASTDGYDPQYITDFAIGRIQLYILSSADVAAIEAGLF